MRLLELLDERGQLAPVIGELLGHFPEVLDLFPVEKRFQVEDVLLGLGDLVLDRPRQPLGRISIDQAHQLTAHEDATVGRRVPDSPLESVSDVAQSGPQLFGAVSLAGKLA